MRISEAPAVRRTCALALAFALAGCLSGSRESASAGLAAPERVLTVQASAFNSLAAQTDSTPRLTASGAELQPGMRALAVSRDLERIGLGFGTRVRIEGVAGEWVVLDRMHPRWERKIDLYMGDDVGAALEWGVRTVRIRWSDAR